MPELSWSYFRRLAGAATAACFRLPPAAAETPSLFLVDAVPAFTAATQMHRSTSLGVQFAPRRLACARSDPCSDRPAHRIRSPSGAMRFTELARSHPHPAKPTDSESRPKAAAGGERESSHLELEALGGGVLPLPEHQVERLIAHEWHLQGSRPWTRDPCRWRQHSGKHAPGHRAGLGWRRRWPGRPP